MFSIGAVFPAILIEAPDIYSYVTFQLVDIPDLTDVVASLGNPDGNNYTVISTTANLSPGWYTATVTWNGVLDGFGEFIPALFFGVDITITVTSGGQQAGPFVFQAFEVSPID
jgi:hypothetical protein